MYFLNLFILFLHTCYRYVCLQRFAFVRGHMWHKALLIWYLMKLELTLVSSLNDLWLVRWVYIGVILPLLECVYFGLLYQSLIFDMFIVVCLFVCVLVLEWLWVSLPIFFLFFFWVCVFGSFVVLSLLVVLSPLFCICIHMSVYICVCVFSAFFFRLRTCLAVWFGLVWFGLVSWHRTSSSRHWPPCQCTQNWIYVLQPNGQHYHTRRSLSEASGQIHLPRK